MPVLIRPYLSPTLVLLAYDWPEGFEREDFLGFAIERTPGLFGTSKSWLPNRIGFDGPRADHHDIPSNQAPIQRFYWWDARIDDSDRGSQFTYTVVPVVGTPDALELVTEESATIEVTLPETEEHGIGSYFNRAVVSSQSFSRRFPELNTPEQRVEAQAWLGNGMQLAVPQFLERAQGKSIQSVIYHLTDPTWVLPALTSHDGPLSLVYNQTSRDHTSDAAVQELISSGRSPSDFEARTHANIMHNKFLVRSDGTTAEALLTGSANFTPEGLSAQANLIHTFESPELAALYLERHNLLAHNPGLAATRKEQTGWSDPIQVGDAAIRAFFSPEPNTDRESLDTIVHAIRSAQHSVLLCAYDPTDAALLDAFVQAADSGKMALGLVNRVPRSEPTGDPNRADVAASITIYHQSQEHHDIVGFDSFSSADTPDGFEPERVLWPGEDPRILVRVHHKFVVIDAEGDNPVVFTGSANFSNNSLHNNDENLLEITRCPRLAGIYMAEFLRLFEHYRSRMAYRRREAGDHTSFTLTRDSTWATKFWTSGSLGSTARQALAGTL